MTDETTTTQESPTAGDAKDNNPLAALAAALAAAQGEFKAIIPDRTVKVRTKDGGSYEFRYATLGAVLEACTPALSRHGLAVVVLPDAQTVKVQIRHADGGVLQSSLPLAPAGDWQRYGSSLTYVRRYLVSAMLNVASEYDDDGNRGEGNEVEPRGFDLWAELDKHNVPTEPSARRAWCERALQRDLPNADSIRDVDVATLLDVAKGKTPMPPERQPAATKTQQAALNDALTRLAPWGAKALDGLDSAAAAAARKNAKLDWASRMVKPPRRVATFAALTFQEAELLIEAASAGEMPTDDQMPAWADPQGEPAK